jgi:hypothetical protein
VNAEDWPAIARVMLELAKSNVLIAFPVLLVDAVLIVNAVGIV